MTTNSKYPSSSGEVTEEALMQVGLTSAEAKVYLALLWLGSTAAGPLIKKSALHRATVYDALRRLTEKGLASYILVSKRKQFQPAAPTQLLERLRLMKEEVGRQELKAQEIVQQIEAMRSQASTHESAEVYSGRRGLQTVLEQILNAGSYCGIASEGQLKAAVGAYYYRFQTEKKKSGFHAKILIDERLRGSAEARSMAGSMRFLSKETARQAATFIYGDCVAFFVFGDTPTAFVIKSKRLGESFQSYFNLLWKQAKS